MEREYSDIPYIVVLNDERKIKWKTMKWKENASNKSYKNFVSQYRVAAKWEKKKKQDRKRSTCEWPV